MALLLPTAPEYLRLQARRRGTNGGLYFGGAQTTYGDLFVAVERLAAWLVARGLGAGDHVAVMAANQPGMVALMYAVWAIGAAAVPIPARSTEHEAARLLSHSRARALLCDPARAPRARAAATAAGVPVFACAPAAPLRPRVVRRCPRRAKPPAPRRPQPDTIAVLAYTSGTTGAPRGALITHANLWWSALACATARNDRPDNVAACLSPLTHTPVFVSHLLCRLLLGSSTVLFERFDVAAVLEAVECHGVTDLPLVAGMVFDIVGLEQIPHAVRRTIEKVSIGGAATPLSAKRKLAQIFAGAEIIEAYGQSESTDGVTMARGNSVFERPGTVGTMNPYVHVAVSRADGSLADAGEEGEIVISGPTVMPGYYRDPEATVTTIRDGWLHSGDLGRQDDDGYFFITGRLKDLIISGGENVSPAEVEAVLRAHPDVADVAVIGTPHPKWGEQVTAVIVQRTGTHLDRTALVEFAGKRLAPFKQPRRIELVDRLPRNAANKVQTNLLKEHFSTAPSPLGTGPD